MLKNGDLLDAAESAGFFAMLSADQNPEYRQNLAGRRLALGGRGNGKCQTVDSAVRAVSY
jgi:hypothetical protein